MIGRSRFLWVIRRSCFWREVGHRLLAKGKSKMSIVGAAMHKLLRQVFGVLKSQKPFDPNFLLTLTK